MLNGDVDPDVVNLRLHFVLLLCYIVYVFVPGLTVSVLHC